MRVYTVYTQCHTVTVTHSETFQNIRAGRPPMAALRALQLAAAAATVAVACGAGGGAAASCANVTCVPCGLVVTACADAGAGAVWAASDLGGRAWLAPSPLAPAFAVGGAEVRWAGDTAVYIASGCAPGEGGCQSSAAVRSARRAGCAAAQGRPSAT